MTTGTSARLGVFANAPEHFEAVDLRQLQIEQHQRRLLAGIARLVLAGAEQPVERLLAVARDDDFVADVVARQRAQRQRFVVGVVFDQQNHFSNHATSRALRRGGRLGRLEREAERRAAD